MQSLPSRVGQHIIIFRVEDTTIYIVRVLHGSMDFIDKLSSC
ncbi:MAG: type II toxin-antitoxin system RelE/ParE family toxin [Candidatus Anammoxibacter sp.]